jgi:dihydrofolate synthase / folylpolyglutamate synthase
MTSALDRLSELSNYEHTGSFASRQYTQDAMRSLLSHLGDPQSHFRSIHVAGTNGKGSVCHMLHSVFSASGCRTGLYTSPHLERINERIVINGAMIPDDAAETLARELFSAIDATGAHPSYFDALTIIAFRHFQNEQVDIAVVETGLGGRLDSTNVILPCMAIITDISIDHKAILGPSLPEIAAEKAGIIKHGIRVVSSNSSGPAREVIENAARESSARLDLLDRDFQARTIDDSGPDFLQFDYEGDEHSITGLKVKTHGLFQARNAAVAVRCLLSADEFGLHVPEASIRKGLGSLEIPGRMALLSRSPLILFDPAHNPAALEAVLGTIARRFPHKKIVAAVSFMKDKDYSGMLRTLATAVDALYCLELDDPRCMKMSDPEALNAAEDARELHALTTSSDLCASLARRSHDGELLLFTGSFRLFKTAKEISLKLSKSWF